MSDEKSDATDLFRHATAEIRWGKQQQWQLSYYAILLFGAIHLLFDPISHVTWASQQVLQHFLSVLALLALFIGSKIVADFQSFLVKNRRILKRIYQAKWQSNGVRSYVTEGFVWIRNGDDLPVGYFKDKTVWVSVIVIQLVAAFSVRARTTVDCAWQLVAWTALDVLAVTAAVCWALWKMPPEADPANPPPPESPSGSSAQPSR